MNLDATTYKLGRYTFKLADRDLGDDGGLAIHVYGPTLSGDEEVLRFDCFRHQPHYHIAWSYRDDPFIPIEATDPFAWAIDKLRTDFVQLLAEADAVPASAEELHELDEVLNSLALSGASPDKQG